LTPKYFKNIFLNLIVKTYKKLKIIAMNLFYFLLVIFLFQKSINKINKITTDIYSNKIAGLVDDPKY
jgi:hypothetical protein